MKEISQEEFINLKSFSSDEALKTYNTVGLTDVEDIIIGKYFGKKAKVLDIECGLGRTTIPLHEKGFNVIGIDISEPMIEKAKALYPYVDFRLQDTTHLDFDAESFDYALFSFNGLDCIYPESKRVATLLEINRVLKKDGTFIFSSHNTLPFIRKNIKDNINLIYWIVRFLYANIINRSLFDKYRIEKSSYGDLILYFRTYAVEPIDRRKSGHSLYVLIAFRIILRLLSNQLIPLISRISSNLRNALRENNICAL